MQMTLFDFHRAMRENANHKRFNERWVADPEFRRALFQDPSGAVSRYSVDISAEDARAVIDVDKWNASPSSRAMWQIVQAKSRWVHEFYWREAVPIDPRVVAWRDRQIARQLLDLGPFPVRSNIHASLSIELTKGCSVGCWFCALSPERLSSAFRHDDAGEALWRGVLRVFHDVLGPGAKSGFFYWGTDPLDNPDYEQFCIDFHDEIGVFPPTTTALPLKDPARTRRLLELSRARGCWINRFSILSTKMLDRVHAEFSADELAGVECLPLTREGAFAFGNAGRFRERAKQDPELMNRQRQNLRWAPWYTGDPAYAGSDEYPLGSIGCVTGFLVNMVERKVQLISPCTADDENPEGSLVFEEDRFDGAEDLAALLERMICARMSTTVRPQDRPGFHPWLRYEETADGIRLHGRFNQVTEFGDRTCADLWRSLGSRVTQSRETAEAIVQSLSAVHRLGPDIPQSCLDALLRAGVLDERRL